MTKRTRRTLRSPKQRRNLEIVLRSQGTALDQWLKSREQTDKFPLVLRETILRWLAGDVSGDFQRVTPHTDSRLVTSSKR